jgi:predicted small secreted protein
MKKGAAMARKFFALLSLIGFTIVLAGCNTVEGVGKDVKATGQAIEKAADKNKTY